MTQEDKELLLRDLCARLPYGVVIQEKCLEHNETFFPYAEDNKVVNIDANEDLVITNGGSRYYIEDIKPYLFPLLMTEEQKEELNRVTNGKFISYGTYIDNCKPRNWSEWGTTEYNWIRHHDVDLLHTWLNKNHFDYRGLIEKGLAIDATGQNVY